MVSDSCLLGAHPHGCAPSQYPVLKVPAAARPRGAARQGDILPDRGRAGGGDPGLHGIHTFGSPVAKGGPPPDTSLIPGTPNRCALWTGAEIRLDSRPHTASAVKSLALLPLFSLALFRQESSSGLKRTVAHASPYAFAIADASPNSVSRGARPCPWARAPAPRHRPHTAPDQNLIGRIQAHDPARRPSAWQAYGTRPLRIYLLTIDADLVLGLSQQTCFHLLQ